MIDLINKKLGSEEAVHYLKVLLKNGVVFQPEIRDSLEFAIAELQGSME